MAKAYGYERSIMSPYCNPKQNDAIERLKKKMAGKAYILIVEILNEEEETKAYEVRYNDRSRLALDYKVWQIEKQEDEPEIRKKVREFVHLMFDQLLDELGENEVVMKRAIILADGYYDED